MWEFSVALYMISIWPNSLLFTAIYGVVESASIAIFGPFIGALVDRLTYLQVNSLLVPNLPLKLYNPIQIGSLDI
jgi:solute carrier family 40 (iron-regulated transporter), member 1